MEPVRNFRCARAASSAAVLFLVGNGFPRLAAQGVDTTSSWLAPTLPGPTRNISLAEFLEAVNRSNPDLAAQRSAVAIASSSRQVARVYPNPSFSLGYTRDLSGQHLPSTLVPSLGQSVLLGGKIGARTEMAEQTYRESVAEYDDLQRTLTAQAAAAYVDAMIAEMAAQRRRQSAEAFERLAIGDEARFRAGDIAEVNMLQSRVERLRARADFLQAESGHQSALLALSVFIGSARNDTILIPMPYREVPPRTFDLTALIDSAIARRPDVLAARRATDAAAAGIRLAHANRVSDVDLGVSVAHNSTSTNSIAPSPAWPSGGFSLGVAIPLSNIVNHGDLAVAQYTYDQARQAQRSVELRAENDVRQAYVRYRIAVERLKPYSGTLLADAERVLSERTLGYRRGAAPLTDVLVAQQALNDVYLSYYDALGEHLKSLFGVLSSSGRAVRDF